MFVRSGAQVIHLQLGRRIMPMCACKKFRTGYLCDYVIGQTRGGKPIVCSRPVCSTCKRTPKDAQEKDFCPEHGGAWLKANPATAWVDAWGKR